MKRFLSILLTMALLACCFGAVAETPAGYPAVRIDPATGKPYDLGGRTVYVYDYWSGVYDWHDIVPDTPEEQAQYDYRLWIEKTYNCKVHQIQKGNWLTNCDELTAFVENPDETLCLYVIPPNDMGEAVSNNAAADWNRSTSIDTKDEKWNQATVEGASSAGGVYGVSCGSNEPRQCLFFNKRILEEAGLDWNAIYDMQADGSWTWENFEELLKTVQQDTDNDGVIDVYGLTGSNVDMYQMGVFSNGGDFFHYDENGQLAVGMTDEKTVQGLEWSQQIWADYAMEQPEDANWDWYKDAWFNGNTAFYMYQAYGGFNNYSEMTGMEDDWGCVAFPVGPEGDGYVTIVSENVTVIPNVYDDKTVSELSLIYDLWMQPTPGYDDADSWIGNKYDLTDERAVDETYAMLRDPQHGVSDLTNLLGSVNDVLGVSLLWNMGSTSVGELIEAGLPTWQALCDEFNSKQVLTVDLSGLNTVALPDDLVSIEANAFENIDAQVVMIPEGCKTIGDQAFANSASLVYVVIPASVTEISADAFSGCTSLQRILVQRRTYASQYCWENGLTCLYLADDDLALSYVNRVWTLEIE